MQGNRNKKTNKQKNSLKSITPLSPKAKTVKPTTNVELIKIYHKIWLKTSCSDGGSQLGG